MNGKLSPTMRSLTLAATTLTIALMGAAGISLASDDQAPPDSRNSIPIQQSVSEQAVPGPAAEQATTTTETTAVSEGSGVFADGSEAPPTYPRCGKPIAPNTPRTELNTQLLPLVQRGYTLAQRGAPYSAQGQFVQVLRRVAQAKDAASGSEEHSRALAAGLQALDEAQDFVPQGHALETDIDMRLVVSSHRTQILRGVAGETPPREAIVRYHRFAQEELARAVAGEHVGSMALYGLGKIAQQCAERSDGGADFTQTEMTMYAAALAACSDNYLAANELGVCLCKTGQPGEAARIFEHTIDARPNSIAYHNLAVAQQKLGFLGEAAANEQESQRLARCENTPGSVSRRAGVEWITPTEMSGIAQSTEFPANVVAEKSASNWQQGGVSIGKNASPPSSWQKFGRLTKTFSLPGSTKNAAAPPQPEPSGAAMLPTPPNQSQWR